MMRKILRMSNYYKILWRNSLRQPNAVACLPKVMSVFPHFVCRHPQDHHFSFPASADLHCSIHINGKVYLVTAHRKQTLLHDGGQFGNNCTMKKVLRRFGWLKLEVNLETMTVTSSDPESVFGEFEPLLAASRDKGLKFLAGIAVVFHEVAHLPPGVEAERVVLVIVTQEVGQAFFFMYQVRHNLETNICVILTFAHILEAISVPLVFQSIPCRPVVFIDHGENYSRYL